MDTLLNKFSLQNLLRQFFCGVVFFVPLYLFCPQELGEWSSVTAWKSGAFLVFASLASIIGTIIYHLEKNLYSYAVQTIFELLASWKDNYLRCVLCAIALVFSIALWLFFFGTKGLWVIVAFLVFLLILVLWLFASAFRRVVARTQECWYCEEKALNGTSVTNLRIFAIANRVSAWSDFIHCTQSCCFAWILGCSICRFSWNFPDSGTCPCPCHECLNEPLMNASVGIALCILVMELIFDWHRYQHVIEMTKMSGIYDNNPLFKQDK